MAAELGSKSTTSGDEETVIAELALALDGAPSDEDSAAWLAMSPAQRSKALVRISILDRWNGERRDLSLEAAAGLINVNVKRFYEIASAWRKRRDLAALGVFARSPNRRSRLDPRAINLLRSLIPPVIDAKTGYSIESLRAAVLALTREAVVAGSTGEPDLRLPSRMVVRRMIERELARRQAKQLVAYEIALDRCPVSLTDSSGVQYTLFAVIDRATGLLFGVSVARYNEGVAGYAAAARDALDRIPRLLGAGEWADATQCIDLYDDVRDPTTAVSAAIAEVSGAPELNLSTAAPGARYLRAAVGDRLGRAELRASISLDKRKPAPVNHVYTLAAARLELLKGTDAHNAAIVERSEELPKPPENLVAVLSSIAALTPPVPR